MTGDIKDVLKDLLGGIIKEMMEAEINHISDMNNQNIPTMIIIAKAINTIESQRQYL